MQRPWQLQERLLCPCRWKVIESDGQRRVWTTWQTKSDRLANNEGYKWLQSDGSWRILSAVVTVEAAAILALVSRSFLSLNCCRQIEKTWVCMVRNGKRYPGTPDGTIPKAFTFFFTHRSGKESIANICKGEGLSKIKLKDLEGDGWTFCLSVWTS